MEQKEFLNGYYAKPKNQSSFPRVFSGNLYNGCPIRAFGHDEAIHFILF